MKKYRFECIIFVVDAIAMILELVASRVLSPYFGNSNFVWTSVIGIILLSGSIGNYIGGILADKKDVKENLKRILVISAITIFWIPFIQNYVVRAISTSIEDIRLGAILATMILFFAPSLFMGLLTPIIVKLKLEDLETAGKVSGRIHAIATIGGIAGTFLGGFFLIPNFGSIHILFVLAIIILALVILVDFQFDLKTIGTIFIIGIFSICIMVLFMQKNKDNGEAVFQGAKDKIVSYDTQYGRVMIYNAERNGEPIRILNIDSGYESATFTDESKRNELVFDYTKFYDLMFQANREIQDTLLIGGAGYSYPKYFMSHYQNKNMDVVEIDGDITKIAKKYFYLDDLIKQYGLENNHRLNLITEDGRTYFNRNTKQYDAILNDAFSGESPAKTLTTLECVQKIKNSLNENGVYLTNIISSLEGKNAKFLKAEFNTLKQVFLNVYVVPCDDTQDLEKIQNNMVIATDSTLQLENAYRIDLDADEIILTDDFCPVDVLIPQR